MSDSDDGDAGVVVGEIPPTMVRKHIKKRALRNKSLSVSFDEKNLKFFFFLFPCLAYGFCFNDFFFLMFFNVFTLFVNQ